jgi:3-hydroxy-5-methyl-1-naphthoate 3-O-methyltransferase
MSAATTTAAPAWPTAPCSPEPIYRLLFGRPITHIVLTALDLGVFDLLSNSSQSLDDACGHIAAPRHSGEMLLNSCVAIGLLEKKEGLYSNTTLTQTYLVAGRLFFLGGLIAHFRSLVYPAWDHLKQAILEDGPQISRITADKNDIFQATDKPSHETELFIAAMHNLSVSDGLLLANAFDFSTSRRLLDIGGGSGALCLALASRFPALETAIFDRPQVCAMAKRYISEAHMETQVQTLAGDAFKDALPEGFDVILMSLFIHAFGLERCTPLLHKCFATLPPGGCVLIYEPVLQPDGTGPMTTLLSSLNMLVVTPSGGDVTAADYQRWLEREGFQNVFYKPVPGLRHLIGGYKPL